MANFQDIKGFNIQSKSSDPVPFAQEKADNPWGGAWASGGNMNSARFICGGSGAVHTAALVFGGRNPALSPGPNSNFTESYDGSSWTEVGDMNVSASYWAGMGTNTAALAVGGSPPATAGPTEQWNGASWTAKNALSRAPSSPQGGTYGMGNGTTTSALFYGGDEGSASKALTEEFDGTSWTEVGDLNTGRGYGAGFGTNAEQAICAGGLAYPPGNLAIAEKWNGTSWTEVGDLNTARLLYNGSSTQAPSSDGLVYSGVLNGPNASQTATESWNGTSWTEVSDLATARRAGGGGGIGSDAILSGGSPDGSPPYSTSNVTEEWTFSGIPPTATAVGYSDSIIGDMYYNTTSGKFKAIKTGGAPIGTWASGGTANTARRSLRGFGPKTATLATGGYSTAPAGNTETYDGTSWTEVSDLNTSRFGMGGGGPSSSGGLVAGGNDGSTPVAVNEIWNGASWTESGDLNQSRSTPAGSATEGSPTAGLIYGGYTTTQVATNESWNGSSWTEVGDLNETKNEGSNGTGTQTAALCIAGNPRTANVEQWNGTAWTEINNLNTARNEQPGGNGSTTSALVYGGDAPPGTNKTEAWDGSSWTEVGDLATPVKSTMGAGGSSSASGMKCMGYTTTNVATTEEWTAADFQIKTVTTS